jgi:hypothetical protein
VEQDVRRQTVHRRQTDEDAADGALADERDGRRPTGRKRLERSPGGCIESPPVLVATRRDAEPRGTHGAARRRHALDVLRDASVLRDGRAGEDACEDGRRGGDPEGGAERASVAAAEPPERKREHVPRASHYSALPDRRCRYAFDFSRLPQTCIEHQLDDRLREVS